MTVNSFRLFPISRAVSRKEAALSRVTFKSSAAVVDSLATGSSADREALKSDRAALESSLIYATARRERTSSDKGEGDQ